MEIFLKINPFSDTFGSIRLGRRHQQNSKQRPESIRRPRQTVTNKTAFVKEFGCEKDRNPSKHQNKNLAKNTSAEFQKNLKGDLKEEEFASEIFEDCTEHMQDTIHLTNHFGPGFLFAIESIRYIE